MKKVVALLLALATVLAIAIVPTAIVTSADGVPFTVEVAEVEGKYYAGDIVSVTLNVTSNPGVSSFTVAVIDNPALVYVDCSAGETYPAPTVGTPTGRHQFVFLANGGVDISSTGTLLTLNFEVAADATEFTPYTVDIAYAVINGKEQVIHNKAEYENNIAVDGVVYAKANFDEFVGASVELTENFNVVFSAHVMDPDSASYARFTMNDYVYDLVEGVFNDETGYFDYVFEGVAPQAIGDLIKAELIADDETTVLDTVEDYSIRDYCYHLLGDEGSSDALKTLLADILVYGAAAQIAVNYATGDLVDRCDTTTITIDSGAKVVEKDYTGLTALVEAYKSEYVTLTEDDGWDFYFDNDNGGSKIYFNGAYVIFDSCAKLVVNFSLDAALEPYAGTSANLNKYWLESFSDGVNEYAPEDLVEDGEGNYELIIPVSMGAFSDYALMDIAPAMKYIKKSGTKYNPTSAPSSAVDTLHYGIMCYAYAVQDSDLVEDEIKDLVKTLVNYGNSAEAYLAE